MTVLHEEVWEEDEDKLIEWVDEEVFLYLSGGNSQTPV